MTVADLKELVMLQLGEDPADVADYDALLDVYLEQGYVKLVDKYKSGNRTGVEPLATENILPEWTHTALSDFATYRIMQNGNVQKQQRGQTYLAAFLETLAKLRSEADEEVLAYNEETYGSRQFYFTNLYN